MYRHIYTQIHLFYIHISKVWVVIITTTKTCVSFQQESWTLFKKKHAKTISCFFFSGIYDQSQFSESLFICALRTIGCPEHAC